MSQYSGNPMQPAADAMNDTTSRIKDAAGSVADSISATADKVRERASGAIDAARKAGASAAETASSQVQLHPLSSVGVAFIAGLVLGVVMDRLISD